MTILKKTVFPLLWLAIPLACTGVLQSGIFFFETLFLSRLGADTLAAGSLVSWLFGTFVVIVFGILSAINVLIAHQHGARNEKAIALIVRDGIWLAVLLVIPAFLFFWNISPWLLWLGQSPDIVLLATSYIHAAAWGLLPNFILLALLEVIIGLGHARLVLIASILSVSLNVFSSYVLIFGKFGFPALQIAGAGWGMTISYWVTAIVVGVYLAIHKDYQPYFRYLFTFTKPSYLGELFHTGMPMGLMYCVEVGFFLALTLVMGLFGSAVMAANQVALQYLSVLMALIFSIAQAITVRMGHLLGAKDPFAAERAGYTGIAISALVMALVAFCYWYFPLALIAIDFDVLKPENQIIVDFSIQFLAICGIYQFFDGIRVALFGVLRGLKDTRFTLYVSILSFWGIALPLGYFLGVTLNYQGAGLWWGLVFGSVVSVCLLYYRFKSQMSHYYEY